MTGFEYTNKKGETPFETFLRYTDEKVKSAAKLAAILQEHLQADAHILDIGTGNGEYLDLALSQVALPENTKVTLVEPSPDLVVQLKRRFAKPSLPATVDIITADLQSFTSDQQFDIILMAHLFYHVSRAAWTKQLAKALSLLKPEGRLVIVLREKDDVYDFKMAFKPQLFDASFKALTIDDVLAALPREPQLRVTKQVAASELTIPFRKNMDDTVSIVEFFLNKTWAEIPADIQHASLQFIADKHGVFKQLDGIAVVEKVA